MEQEVKHLFKTTDLTQDEIADRFGTTRKVIWRIIDRNFSAEERRERKRQCYSKSKLGDKNPQFGKIRPSKGPVSDNKGYLLILKPSWYTGRPNSNHIFYHHYVLCLELGLTEVPVGWVVHHIDHNPLNNNISNLVLLTKAAHTKLHCRERATTRAKARTLEANASGSATHLDVIGDDIVCSL